MDYFRLIKSMKGVRGNLGEVVRTFRKYLRQEKAQTLSGWFESPTPTRMEEIRYDLVVEQDDLIKLSKKAEFQQLLMESSIKTTEAIIILESVIGQNGALIETIKKELVHHQ